LEQRTPPSPADIEKLARAEAAAASGDLADAEAILAEMVGANPANASAQSLYCRILLRQKKNPRALAAAEAAVAADASEPRMHATLANTLLKLDRLNDARGNLERAVKQFVFDAPLQGLLAEALLKSGDTAGAMKAIERASELDPGSSAYPTFKIVVLCVAGEEDIPEMLRARADEAALAAAIRDMTHFFRTHNRLQAEATLRERSVSVLPDLLPLRIVQAERLIGANQAAQALALLDENKMPLESVAVDQATWFLRTRANALKVLKDRGGAIDELRKVLDFNPDDEIALRGLYMLHQQLGNANEMRSYAKRLAGVGARKMPETLAQGLDELQESTAGIHIEQDKLDWAWSIADQTKWQREPWMSAVEWGRRADMLLRAWWLNLPERGAEIAALIDPPERGMDDLVPRGTRCLSVTTHLGPIAGYVNYMQNCGRPFRGFGFAGPDQVVGDAPPMRIASNAVNRGAALRELVGAIHDGTVIGFAQDTPDAAEGMRFEFLGRSILISTLVPRLAAKHRTTSVWCQPLWRGGRIVLEIDRLPDPEDGEPSEQWCRRWCEAYLAKLEPIMRGAPQNLNLGPGIWLNARRKG
jgi:tetratricopeptide (TPR) repeat protein